MVFSLPFILDTALLKVNEYSMVWQMRMRALLERIHYLARELDWVFWLREKWHQIYLLEHVFGIAIILNPLNITKPLINTFLKH